MKNKLLLPALSCVIIIAILLVQFNKKDTRPETLNIPEKVESEEYNEELMKLKTADWTAENAGRHQLMLKKYQMLQSKKGDQTLGTAETFGSLKGAWSNRGPRNMPGAFKFAEMLDGTDTIYAVTHNHYSGEYNSKSYIFKGTVYNPISGSSGDD